MALGLGRATSLILAMTKASTYQAIALKAKAIAAGIATKAQWLWNAAMSANPIGAVITALSLLTLGIYALIKAQD